MAGIILLVFATIILLKNNGIQNRIADEVVSQLSQKLNTKVSIGKVDYQYFNRFRFDSLYVEDQHRDTLLFVDKAYADFNLWKFFKGKFVFNDIELEHLMGNMVIDTAGVSNFDFIIKAFSNPDKPKTKSNIEFNFKNIKLSDSRFKFTNLMHAPAKDLARFDVNRMNFSDINLNIKVDYLKSDSLLAGIRSLSMKERSGLQITNLETTIHGWKTGFHFPHLDLSLPNSKLTLDSVHMTYDSIANLKDVLNKVKWTAEIKPSKISLSDFSAFVPNFSKMKDPATIKGKLSGRINNFRIKNMELTYGNSLTLKTDVDLNGFPNIDETFIYAKIKDFHINKADAQDFISQLSNRPVILPKELSRLGIVKYSGNITGFFSNMVAYGNITTDLGSLNTDILIKLENKLKDLSYNGTIRTDNFQLGRLLATNTLGKVAFKLNTIGGKLHKKSFQGTVKADVSEIYLNKYNYKEIALDGKYDGNGFDGKVNINDANLKAKFDGMVDLTKKLPVLNFELLLEHADIHALNLTNQYVGSNLSFHGSTNMVGNSLDNLNGYLLLDSIRFDNGGKSLAINQLLFESQVEKNTSRFTITSDLINGYFAGDFKYSTIPQTISALLRNYIPALSGVNISGNKKKVNVASNYMDIDLTMSDTRQISEVLNLPFTLDGITTVKGYVDDINKRIELNAQTPFLSFGKRKIQDIVLNLNNLDKKLNLLATGNYNMNNSPLNFNLKAAAANDSLYTQFGWQNNDSIVNAGEFQATTRFEKTNNLTSAFISILPTQLILKDSVWDVLASKIDISPDKTISIHNFKIKNKAQFINLDGVISKDEEKSLAVDMNDLDIDFIMSLLNFKPISVKGYATGHADVFGVLKQPVFETDLFVKHTVLNNAFIGDAYLHSAWDRDKNELLASGTFINGKDTVAKADGVYIPKNDSLDFNFEGKNLNLAFLQRYLGAIVQDVNGLGTGNVRMYGRSKTIGFEGNIFAKDARVTVGYLKTTYSFTDTVYMTRKSIALKNIKIYDEEKNQGTLNGIVTHDGIFRNLAYDLKVNARNMLAINTQATDNDYFYGKAYATGTVHIYGNERVSNIDVNARSQPKTKIYISAGSASTANDNTFITFVNHNDTANVKKTSTSPPVASSVNLKMKFLLDVTPDAEIQLILDPKAGDMITGNGSGNLRYEYDDADANNMKLYGNYTIDEGYYLFTLQNLIRKEFKIDQGSSINWSGDLFNAQVDIRALYSVTASLRDLMSESNLSSNMRTSVPVNCVLMLKDNLMQPTIKFDIDLPSSDEQLKLQVKNLINTDEMMNRQMMYLLLFGKFYNPEYVGTTNLVTTGNTGWSFLSTTLSGQLNNWLSQVVTNLSVGVNYRTTGTGSALSQEYETEINYQPNNRLIVNGNFGYRDDNLAKNKIIGDVDVEYILTPNGKLRLKAYNHTVDKYTLRSAPFIQGVGLMYKENFNTWNELVQHYWNILIRKKNEQKSDTTKNIMNNGKTDEIKK